MPIDTLKASKRLQEDDTFSPEQAERIAEILSDLDVASATKDDLDAAEARLGERIDQMGERIDQMGERIDQMDNRIDQLSDRIDQVETRLDQKIDSVEQRLTQRIELSEERLEKQLEQTRKQLLQWMLASVTGVATLVAALVTLINYLMA